MVKRCFVVFVSVAFVLSLGLAAVADGVDAGSFVRDGIGARALGMGGAFVPIGDDATTTLWNPAGLAQLKGINIDGMYANKFGLDIYYQSLVATARLSKLGVGFTLVRSSINDIPFYGGGQGGVFSETQALLIGSLGYNLGSLVQTGPISALLVGGNVKYYSHSLLEGRGTGIGFDVGALVRFSPEWGDVSLGIVSLDTGGTAVKWSGTTHNPVNNVPWIITVGAAYTTKILQGKLNLAADADIGIRHPNLNRFHIGLEVFPVEQLGVRGGAIFAADGTRRFTAGATLTWHGITLDYAWVPHQTLGTTHVFSVRFQFPGWWKKG